MEKALVLALSAFGASLGIGLAALGAAIGDGHAAAKCSKVLLVSLKWVANSWSTCLSPSA